MMNRWIVTLGALVGGSQVALAAPPKVEFLCGVFSGGKISAVLPDAKNPKITEPVACAVHLADVGATSYTATVTSTRHMVNPANGDHADGEFTAATGTISHKSGDGDDLEVVMTPGKANDDGEVVIDTCENFDLTATVANGKTVVFTKTIKIVQSCPAAKTAAKPAPKPAKPAAPTTTAVDDVTIFKGDMGMRGYSVEMGGKGVYYVFGGCYGFGTGVNCEATLYTDKGKLLKSLSSSYDASDENRVDKSPLKKEDAALHKLIDGNSGVHILTKHVLDAKGFKYDTINFRWDEKSRVLSVLDGTKVFKKVSAPKIQKGMMPNDATVWLFEAGSPGAAILEMDSSAEAGMGSSYASVIVPLPELNGGD